MKRFIAHIINRALSPFSVRIVAERELNRELENEFSEPGNPSACSLRQRLFKQLAGKGFSPTHIIDVGAHKAEWSRDAHKIFPESAFTLIEPQIEMKPYLDQFCSEAKNARWILAGAGAAKGELLFTIAPRSDSSSFTYSEADAEEQGLEQRVVPVVTLNLICEESSLPIPEIVKIDAEGFDLKVMVGAQRLLGVTELFFVELPLFDFWPDQSFHTITAFMREHGYEPYDVTDLNRRPGDGALAMMELAFAKKTGVLRNDNYSW